MNSITTPLRDYVSQNVIIDTTEKDHLSNIPSDLFKEITDDLPLKEMRALSLTCRTIFKIVDPLILLKTQWLLENLESSLLIDNIFEESLKNPQDLEKYNDFKVKSKNLSNGSREKCQALRDLICFPFEKQLLQPMVIFTKAPSLHDDFLTTQLIQTCQGIDKDLLLYCDCSDKDHVDSILLYLNVLLKNQIQPNKVQLRFEGNPYESNILEMFLKAIQVNHSINNVILMAENWGYLLFRKFLKEIKNLKHISEVTITESNWGEMEFILKPLIHDKLDGIFEKSSHTIDSVTYKRLPDCSIFGTPSFPQDVFNEVLKHDKSNIVATACVSKQFNAFTKNYVENNQVLGSFGLKEWQSYNGDPGVVPPIPLKMYQDFDSSKEMLTFIPEKINGEKLTLSSIDRFVSDYKNGKELFKSNYRFALRYDRFARTYVGDNSLNKFTAHWVILSKDVKDVLNDLKEIPYLIDVVVSILMHNLKTKEFVYPNQSNGQYCTLTRVQERRIVEFCE